MFNDMNISMDKSLRAMMQTIYGWMSAALAVTAAVSYYISSTPSAIQFVFNTPWLFLVLFLVQIGLVITLSAAISKISLSTAYILFFSYAALTGVTLSSLFMIYDLPSITLTFVTTVGMFASMSAYGYFTKSDLSPMRSAITMGIFGLIIAGVINMFWANSVLDFMLSIAGVAIFTLKTAYDTQMLKRFGQDLLGQGFSTGKIAVLGALKLYLNFINLFLYLLRLLGKRRK